WLMGRPTRLSRVVLGWPSANSLHPEEWPRKHGLLRLPEAASLEGSANPETGMEAKFKMLSLKKGGEGEREGDKE
ncbi:hypothetical protein JOQ06_016930, partial [Pogonophryne albipinna]